MLMAYGMIDEGVQVTAGVRDRYDGAKRNPWNEIECGSNYARSMASWGAVIVLSGFSYDATRGHIGFAPRLRQGETFRSFWSGANGYGTVEIGEGKLKLLLLGGDVALKSFGLPPDAGPVSSVKVNGKAAAFENDRGEVRFKSLRLGTGDIVEIALPSLDLMGLPELARLAA
jgi:non-lysosomal glucosylceramidase